MLALAIITHAVNAWKRCNGKLRPNIKFVHGNIRPGGLMLLHELIPMQIERAKRRNELLGFFGGTWFNFLFQSAVTETTKGRMFGALGIPMGEVL
jgi:hypothetical protein